MYKGRGPSSVVNAYSSPLPCRAESQEGYVQPTVGAFMTQHRFESLWLHICGTHGQMTDWNLYTKERLSLASEDGHLLFEEKHELP